MNSIFSFLFGKPVTHNILYTCFYWIVFLTFILVAIITSLIPSIPWYVPVIWFIAFPLFVRVNHFFAKLFYKGITVPSGKFINKKSVSALLGAAFLQASVLFSVFIFLITSMPGGSFVVNSQSSHNGEVFHLSIGSLKGTYTDFPSISVNDERAEDETMHVPYRAEVSEGSYQIRVHHYDNEELLFEETIHSSTEDHISVPVIDGPYLISLHAEEQAKGIKFSFPLQ
ncbi:hypothetical protein [Alkalicoccobacillus porphyridii]|uniref:Uncharacterized protein n=1 Tax=Alkalicoccobacillus porphyridii TaxID=2597270 RepID=A0A553ZW84_9BACI|nr:hypothetical protein [Alkalicoccobacillus porphyridii]TSB45717.1 hypothetical protein FN960_14615 [Alkalicoccobacillus porphyridii]